MNSTTFHRLVRISPLDLAHLLPAILHVLVEETGVDPASNIYTELHLVQSSEQLAKINWSAIGADLQKYVKAKPKTFMGFIERIRLVSDRAVIHPRLYKSRTIMTCKFLGQYRLPGPTPLEAIQLKTDWAHHEQLADETLARGRACLGQFERIACAPETTHAQLRALLDEAADYYQRYEEHKKIYDEQFGLLCWYIEQSRETVPARQPMLEASVA